MELLGMAMSSVIVTVGPHQGTGITRPGRTPIPNRRAPPLPGQSLGQMTTIEDQPMRERAMDSNLGIVAIQNAIDPEIPRPANASLMKR